MTKVGFIGAGDIAYLHGEGVSSSANAELTGIWNRTRSKAEEKAELFGTKVFDSAEELIDAGACTPTEIDFAIKTSVGVRLGVVGIFQSLDFNGLDLIAGDRRLEELPTYLRSKVEAGDLGVKTGRGFHDYNSPTEALSNRDLAYLAVLHALEASTDFAPIR